MTTFYPTYDFTEQIVGDEGEVESLIPAGTKPHDYEPSAKDLAKIAGAGVFVHNSKELGTQVPNVIENLDTEKVPIVEASRSTQLIRETEEEESGKEDRKGHNRSRELDPHAWLDPVLAQKEVTTTRDVSIKKHLEKRAVFEKNIVAYLERLTALDKEYQVVFAGARNRTFAMQHATFGYLAKQYDSIQEPIAGTSSDQEPSPSHLAELEEYIKTNNISVVYFEASAPTKVVKTLANGIGAELAVLNPLESLTQKRQETSENYVSVVKKSPAALRKSVH